MNEAFVSNYIDNLIFNPTGIALDIGANHGIYTEKLATKFNKVYAFEPHGDNVKILREKVRSERVEIIQKAISDTNGYITFYINKHNPGGHTINPTVGVETKWGHGGDVIQVEAITIDEFCKDKTINFIKMDIESAENFVWKGAIETLKNNDLTIMLEVHQTVDSVSLKRLFEELGYVWYNEHMNLVKEDHVPPLDAHYLIKRKS